MSYELKLEQFSGPLDKLLELIEERKLGITEISLAQVTGDFLAYLETLKKAEKEAASPEEAAFSLGVLSDFIVVASRLILIKSKSLLPEVSLTDEEEAEIKDLERRLSIYRDLKPAMKILARLWNEGNREFSRPYLLVRQFAGASGAGERSGSGIFYPGENLDAKGLADSLGRILDAFKRFELETQTIKEKIVTIEEKIQEIVGRLTAIAEITFKDFSEKKSRSEIIVIFLAMLHLAREQLIFLEQKAHFSDIIIRKNQT